MGMDYQYAGSASYPRFDRELCAIAEVFGGIKTEHLNERENTEGDRIFGYWFGFLSSDNTDNKKFLFPEGTNETLVKWFNDVYGESYTPEETRVVWECVKQHPEIKDISYQIWRELEQLVYFNEEWRIT